MTAIDGSALATALDAQGWALLPRLLDEDACDALAARYDGEGFRSRVVMQRHGFGQGEYKYFAHPLPPPIPALREDLYAALAPLANAWHERLGLAARFPPDHAGFLARCHAAGQSKPTPLLLRYGPGDHNCLHQDVYGDLVFPMQATVLLSRPGEDFSGGEFVLTEQRPRLQSRAEVVPLGKGDAVVFAVRLRPRRGTRGDYRVAMRHGVSTVRAGSRHTLGIILHDAA
ncbi:2OG-Fe(II) oxygenase [Falsiroseomonas sp. HW251]|uniref:2OG-Fe(II) oxygenase n=1 Tax=Falsiroseomonas sp. HW251 TaxID=3390998 RepID=UPI003D310DA7